MQNRRLAAILFTDIVGYTAAMQQDEGQAVSLIRQYHSVLQKTVAEHGGEILNDYGDGSLCVFPSATEALQCALDTQNQLGREPQVPLRIGLHLGEIFFENGKVFGDGVNVASRIQSLGQANTILFSPAIHHQIRNHPQFQSVSLGTFEFKNVGEPMEVFALANDGLIVPRREHLSGKLKSNSKKPLLKRLVPYLAAGLLLLASAFIYKNYKAKASTASIEKTIAILPFKNISVNKEENEPFCVGVTLELQKKLEWIGGLLLIASQSVEKYRDTKMSIGDIAHELGDIKYIVQGTVQRDKNKVKVFATLIDAVSGKQLMSDDFPGEMEDIFSLQENIAQQIASAMQIKITADEQTRIGRVATKNTAAIDAYNDALTSYVRLTSAVHPLYWDSLESHPGLYAEYLKTLSLCDRIIEIDPQMAEAYVLKGQTFFYSILSWSASTLRRKAITDSIVRYANKALHLDKASTDAYVLLSYCFWNERKALPYLEKALAINANNFDVNRALCVYYSADDPEKAIRFGKKAIRISPMSPRISEVYEEFCFAYHCFGDFEKAEWYGKKSIEQPTSQAMNAAHSRVLAVLYLHWGKPDSVIKFAERYLNDSSVALYEIAEAYCNLKNECGKAAEFYERAWKRSSNRTNPHRWAVALMNSGKTQEAKEKIQMAFKEYRDRNDTLSYDYAGICALNGEKSKALQILRQFKWEWGSPYLVQHDKLFDNIRNESEFKEMLKKALDEKTRLREKIKKMEENGEL